VIGCDITTFHNLNCSLMQLKSLVCKGRPHLVMATRTQLAITEATVIWVGANHRATVILRPWILDAKNEVSD
jgi:hypothetical protein